MRFRPCIDLHEGKVKQIIGSSLKETGSGTESVQTRFATERAPDEYAALYRRDGLTGGHVIMLGPGNEEAARQALDAYPGGMQIGGGINAENAASWLAAGAEKVIVTSHIIRSNGIDWSRLADLSNRIGRDHIVIDLSCTRIKNHYYVAAQRWQHVTDIQINESTLGSMAAYCSEFLVHAVDAEGKEEGIDTLLVHLLADITPLPTTYAGGIRDMRDIYKVDELGRGKLDVTVGSALDIFGGNLPYAELVALDKQKRA